MSRHARKRRYRAKQSAQRLAERNSKVEAPNTDFVLKAAMSGFVRVDAPIGGPQGSK